MFKTHKIMDIIRYPVLSNWENTYGQKERDNLIMSTNKKSNGFNCDIGYLIAQYTQRDYQVHISAISTMNIINNQ